jgi:iron(II)-dependent oxidoreductase
MATIAPRDPIAPRHPLPSGPEEALAALNTVREQTVALVDHLSEDELSSVLSPIMSPLVWDLAHIAAYEDLWLAHRHGGLELLRPDLAELYDAFETPRSVRGEIELLGPRQAWAYMKDVRARSAQALDARGVGDGTIYELVIRHELQHSETMRQTMALAGLLPPGEPHLEPLAGANEWIDVPAGKFEMGAGPDGFAYDNERPRHMVELPAFQIARRPVTNASWLSFSEGGGYERREWWSDEGWAWKLQQDATCDPGVASGHPDAPVCHVSWFEADAFARASGARLPCEAEWEKAAGRHLESATWGNGEDKATGQRLDSTTWGNGEDKAAGQHLDSTWGSGRETPEGGQAGAKVGPLQGIGQVWEWTSSRFDGYPGFVAHPYKEYSEVFFGRDYRVLRGGSWATSPRVGTITFRNWDHPIRRQIFAGVRLARDVS